MKTLCVYILQCADDSLYVGVTNNIERRMHEPSTAYAPDSYAAKRLPVKLIHTEFIHGPRTAIKREKQLKNWSHEKKMALVNGHFQLLAKLSKKKFSR